MSHLNTRYSGVVQYCKLSIDGIMNCGSRLCLEIHACCKSPDTRFDTLCVMPLNKSRVRSFTDWASKSFRWDTHTMKPCSIWISENEKMYIEAVVLNEVGLSVQHAGYLVP